MLIIKSMAHPTQRFALSQEPGYSVHVVVTWGNQLWITVLFRIYVLWQIQQGFSLMPVDFYDVKYLDHLSYNLNIMVCQGLGQGWDVMHDIKLYPLSLASEVMFTTLSCNEASVYSHWHLFRLPTSTTGLLILPGCRGTTGHGTHLVDAGLACQLFLISTFSSRPHSCKGTRNNIAHCSRSCP